MTEFDEISELVTFYGKHGRNQSVKDLLILQDRMVAAGFWLGGFVGDIKTDYNEKYFIRKIAISKRVQGLINSGKSASASQAEADSENGDKLKAELEAESNAYKADILLKQLNKVMSAIQQRISHAKNLEDYTK